MRQRPVGRTLFLQSSNYAGIEILKVKRKALRAQVTQLLNEVDISLKRCPTAGPYVCTVDAYKDSNISLHHLLILAPFRKEIWRKN